MIPMSPIITLLRILITIAISLSVWIITVIVLVAGWPVESGGTFGRIGIVATVAAIGVGIALWKSETRPGVDKPD